jgi:hypothetical protein
VRLEIRWPNGKEQTVTGLKLNQYQKIVEGGYPLDSGSPNM